jgi:hypothetical protein
MINTKLQSIIDTKSAIGNAIVNKGGTITSETPFFNYAAQIDGISSGGGAYSTWVVEDENSAKYQVYNGYDAVTNPTPNATNLPFNQWLLNNSASGDIVLSNTIMQSSFYNGINTIINLGNIAFINNTSSAGGTVGAIAINNGFIYAGVRDSSNNSVTRFREDNLAISGSSVDYGGAIKTIFIKDALIYVGGTNTFGSAIQIKRYYESNFTTVGTSATLSTSAGNITSIYVNGGFVYASMDINPQDLVRKFHLTNLANLGQTARYNFAIYNIAINNGFIYAVGAGNATAGRDIKKYYESNLAFVNNSASYGGTIESIAINNGFIYVGGSTNLTVQKFHESNLAFVGNTPSYGTTIIGITIHNGFIYAGGFGNATANRDIKKYYESNLAFVGNSVNAEAIIRSVSSNNGFIYAGVQDLDHIKKYQPEEFVPDNQTYYTINRVKE